MGVGKNSTYIQSLLRSQQALRMHVLPHVLLSQLRLPLQILPRQFLFYDRENAGNGNESQPEARQTVFGYIVQPEIQLLLFGKYHQDKMAQKAQRNGGEPMKSVLISIRPKWCGARMGGDEG